MARTMKKAPELPARHHDKVAILGFTQHVHQAPFLDETWALWGLNDLHALIESRAPGVFKTPRVEWFQIHREAWGQFPGARDPQHTEWLKAQTCPIWMWDHVPEVPASVAYPLHDILQAFPRAYFNNTISWMIALAIHRGYTTIGMWGVDMALDGVHGASEYSWQRPSVEYFVGQAEGRGITFHIPPESEICKCSYLYGYDNVMPTRSKFLDRLEQLNIQDQEASNEYEAIKRGLHENRGALWALRQVAPEHPKVPELEQRELALVNDYEAAKRGIHEIRGAKNNLTWVIRNYFPGEGAFQDLPRTPGSLVLPTEIVDLTAYSVLPDASDGQKPVNRIVAALGTKGRHLRLEPIDAPR